MIEVNSKESVDKLQEVLKSYKENGVELNEVGDLANELGLILGKQCSDKKELIEDFMFGFKHGVDLSKNK